VFGSTTLTVGAGEGWTLPETVTISNVTTRVCAA
jgi:hypothetical protein